MISIIVGTETGTAEYVADEVVAWLEQLGKESYIELEPSLESLKEASTWIICTSTQGAGDVPNNLSPFIKELQQTQLDLSSISLIIIGLGDSSYDRYCGAAQQINDICSEKNLNLLQQPFLIDAQNDNLPEDLAIAWLEKNKEMFN
jgi:MioC protein